MKTESVWLMMNEEDLLKFKHAPAQRKNLNFLRIPVTNCPIDDDGAKLFTDIYQFCMKRFPTWKLHRTKSGAICKKRTMFGGWDVRKTSSCIELTLVYAKGCWRFQFRNSVKDDDNAKLYGRQAWKIFYDTFLKFGIDLNDYAIENGEEVKKTMPKQMKKLAREDFAREKWQLFMENCYHVDFHNSHPAGMANCFPEFREPLEYMYNKRKERKEYKQVLVASWGFMQSIGSCQARWCHIAKAALEDTNRRVEELAKRLQQAGYIIIAYNVDGIWYRDLRKKGPYHGEGEGSHLGEWSTDHSNVKLKFKSAGAYQFIEDGKCYTKLSGKTQLDKVKPRDKDGLGWEPNDMYDAGAEVIAYKFVEGTGIVRC